MLTGDYEIFGNNLNNHEKFKKITRSAKFINMAIHHIRFKKKEVARWRKFLKSWKHEGLR